MFKMEQSTKACDNSKVFGFYFLVGEGTFGNLVREEIKQCSIHDGASSWFPKSREGSGATDEYLYHGYPHKEEARL